MQYPSLHPIERKILTLLSGKDHRIAEIDEIVQGTGLSIDQVRRGVEWLKFKDLIKIVSEFATYILLPADKLLTPRVLPERAIVEYILGSGKIAAEMTELKNQIDLKSADFNAGLARALQYGWVSLTNKQIRVTKSDQISNEEKLLQKLTTEKKINIAVLTKDEFKAFRSLRKRPGFIVEKKESALKISISSAGFTHSASTEVESVPAIAKLTSEHLGSDRWKRLKFSRLDVTAQVRNYNFGRSHPLTDLINEIKEVFVSMGFSEIEGPVIQSAFWNFDVLFTPQDHPAREMQDTFYLQDDLTVEALNKKIIQKVSRFHEMGWNYDWKINQATKHVLRTHTTPVTLKYLSENKTSSLRIFSVGRVFRNEKMTYKHLMEFHQVEGVATGKQLSLRDLMGIQTLFYSRLGINKVKFWPTFFPYTEPSLQSMVYIETSGKWIELFGMGILRPEVTKSIGIRGIALAWGGGLERLAMLRYGLKDVRELYSNKLSWLRSVPVCPL